MQAVILAAGEGVRLRPLTLERPKPLIKVDGKTLLEHNLDQLVGLVDEVILVIGYKGNMIRDYIGNEYQSIKIKYIEQQKQLGTGHALMQVEGLVKEKFLLLMADDLYSKEDITVCLEHDLCVLAKRVENPERFGVFLLDGNKIKDVIEKPKTFVGNLINTGCGVFDKRIFDELRNLKKSERGEYEYVDAIKALAQKATIICEEVKHFYVPIGYPEDLKKAEEVLKNVVQSH